MFTATALMNPVRTEFGMNRTSLPIRSRPRVSITSPVNTERVNSAFGASAMITAIAPVAWTVMNTELVASAPATVPEEVAVEPEDGVHPGQEPGGQPVGDALHPEHQPRAQVLTGVLAGPLVRHRSPRRFGRARTPVNLYGSRTPIQLMSSRIFRASIVPQA